MKLKLTILLLAFGLGNQAQINYAASAIPDSLKKNAHAVFRLDESQLKIISPSKFKNRTHQVVTLLDEQAQYRLFHKFYIDKFNKVEDIKITIYNEYGKAVKDYNRKDFTTQAAYSDNDLVTDDKVMYLQTTAPGYPCTVEVSYEVNSSSYIELPNWVLTTPHHSVELNRLTVQVPADIDIRHRTKGMALQPNISNDGTTKQYVWEVRNLKAQSPEVGAFTQYEQFPMIEIAPNQFSYDDYGGKMTTWADFGAWSYALFESAKPFDEHRKPQIMALLQGAITQKEKLARLYQYMQQNMRYVSIQLGIGGFKPFDVSFVDSKKYGDCKALTNYMHNMLQLAGIPSYRALVNAGSSNEPADPLFPASVFNHVILCAVADGDSTWLECTSNTNEPGKLGSFTENRHALLLTDKGGQLVATPKTKPGDNLLDTYTTIQLGNDGAGSTTTRFGMTGGYTQEFLNYIGETKKDDQKRYLMQQLGFVQPDDFEVSFDRKTPKATAILNMAVEKIPSFTAGSKMFLNPRIHQIWGRALPSSDKRTNDFYLGTPFIKTDTTLYILPEGYGPDNLPKNRKASCEYGSFSSQYTWDASKRAVITIARLEVRERVIPANKYAATKSFFDEVLAEFNEKIVVKKQ
jgi:hypothetical protein